ncbi:hypothetical protein [Rhodococcus olei]|uniref:hypothetical protein n=1 Tax=Rhodococcus olei TaxID=2161675 RepID=UPI0031E4FA85
MTRSRAVGRTAVVTVAALVFAGMTRRSATSAEPGCGLVGTVGTPEVGSTNPPPDWSR